MEAFDFNGGNADLTRGSSNLENVLQVEMPEKVYTKDENGQNDELNGDVTSLSMKKIVSPLVKKKVRKFKSNSSSMENIKSFAPSMSKMNTEKTYDIGEMSTDELEDFYGFEITESEILQPASIILKKLIAEAELFNHSGPRRRKIAMSLWKNIKNADNLIEETDGNSSDSEDQKMTIGSETCNITSEESALQSELKSTNSSVTINSSRLRKSISLRGISPGSTVRQKVSVDITNPAYREPFKYGWKRELVYRAAASENQVRRMADIYYYTPEGKKARSYRDVTEFLTTSELTIDNFTFFKEPLGVNDPRKEIIRDAKKARDIHSSKSASKLSKKVTGAIASKKISPKKLINKHTPVICKTSPKHTKTLATFKVKLPAKKNNLKKEIRSPSATVSESEAPSPPRLNSPTTRKNQHIAENLSPIKTKRISKKKQLLPEVDHHQYFMVSICAGYHALSRIFQYLKVQELLRAARVCRMWRDIAAHPSLWKTVRMKNSQVTDWDGLADTLKNRGTQHLDLRKMLIVGETDNIWKKFVTIIPRVTSLIKLELCRCPATVVEDVMKNCPQLQVLSAMSIKCDYLNLEYVSNLSYCNELRLKAISGMSLQGDLLPLLKLTRITHLSITSVKDLGKKNIEILQSLRNLETLELGECSDFPENFGTTVLIKLRNLERLRLEKGQGHCCTFDILDGISKLDNLTQLELVNFDVKNGFDKYLAICKNIKRLLIIPTYVSQSATSNNMILGGVTELSNNLTHFVWGVTQELLRVTELFVDQCNQMSKQITGDSIPVLKPVPCLKLIEDVISDQDNEIDDKQQQNLSNPQVEILPLPHLQKLLLTALPKTRVKILKIPFHATWRQSISDSTSQ